ncbi:MAG: PAS domain S-box protein [Bacteroidales bacterium]|nr:PAS domain S-box protein [Bacteroidales bacterium]
MFLIDLVYNLSVLVAISVLSGFIDLRYSRTKLNGKVLQGMLFGLATVIGMIYPFVLTEGIIFDGRTVVVSLATAFFGPVTGLISGLIASAYRIFIVGGTGVFMGVLTIVAAFVVGLGFYLYKQHKALKTYNIVQLYLMGLLVHIIMLLLIFTLPGAYQKEVFQMISLTVVGVYPLVNVLIGKILSDQEMNKKLMHTLRDSEAQYRMLITHQTDLVVKVDMENKLRYVSPSYCRLFEKSEEELLGKDFMPLIHEDDRAATDSEMKKLLVPPYSAYIEQRVGTPKGYRWLAWSDKAILDENGKPAAVIGLGRDITDRKNAELENRRNEERYRQLFNAAPLGAILEDTDGMILEVNQTLCDYYEYEPHELIGKQIFVLVPEPSHKLVKENLSTILHNKMLQSTIEGITKSGAIKKFELIETVITLPDGNLGILSLAKDITEQELTKVQLRETQVRNAAIVSAIPDIMCTLNADGVVVDVVLNPDANFRGWNENQVLYKNIKSIVPSSLANKLLQSLSKTLQTNELVSFEHAIGLGHNQTWIDIRMVTSSEKEVLIIVRDISKRKRQEIEILNQNKFIERMLDSIPNPLFYLNREGVYLGINKAFEDFYGVRKKDIVGKKIYELPFEADPIERDLSDQAIFSGKEHQQVLERVIQLSDGSTRDAIITKSSFPDSSDQIGGLIGIIMDITDRKMMEKDLMQAKEKAEESDKLKTAFLNNLSHEIRTPLNAIVGFSELLDMGYSSDQQEKFVRTINSNAEQLLHIIDDVLAISRMDSERMPVEKFDFNVSDLLLDLYDTFEPEAKQKMLKLSIPDLPDITIEADKGKIKQVLSGLISNALKYTDKGSIHFGCKPQNNELLFYTRDTGIGIPESEKVKIFERFYRSDEVQLKAIRGNGLGLSIAKGLVELMQGSLHLKSDHGKGSEFSFTVPLKVSPSPQKKKIQETNPKLSFSNVLVAEDEQDNFELIRLGIKNICKQIDHAHNGKEAVAMVKTNDYDLVLMDLKMPVMNGLDATAIITALKPHLPVVAVSAFQLAEEKQRAKNAGCVAFLEKPIQMQQLFKVLADIGN